MKKQPIAFFDLDGTIRETKSGDPFIKDVDDIKIKRGIPARLKELKNKGYDIIGISNQGGVAGGFKTINQIQGEIKKTLELLQIGEYQPFTNIMFCPYDTKGSDPEFTIKSLFRKPEYGFIALTEWEYLRKNIHIDYDRSFFVGDRPEDTKCASNAGIQFIDITAFLGIPEREIEPFDIPDVREKDTTITLNDEELREKQTPIIPLNPLLK